MYQILLLAIAIEMCKYKFAMLYLSTLSNQDIPLKWKAFFLYFCITTDNKFQLFILPSEHVHVQSIACMAQ